MNLRYCLIFLLFQMALVASAQTKDFPADMVNPYVDSKNSRWFFFNTATRPFGMVNLSPDTDSGGAWGSGYRFESDSIKGLSHVHVWQLSGLSVLPVSGVSLEGDRNFASPFTISKTPT